MQNKPRLLLVEDEAVIAMLIGEMATDFGYDVVATVSTVSQAISCLVREPVLDCVLLDLQLAGERSFIVADALMARGVPFAFITGYGSSILKDTHYMGIPVLPKPFRSEDLKTLLIELLQHQDSN